MKLDPIAIANHISKRQGNFLIADCSPHGVPDFDCVTAYGLPLAVDNHLRRIHAIQPKMLSVRPLPRTEQLGRVRIYPAAIVPIIDVLAQHDQVSAAEGLFLIQRLQ
jgi:hypothetical protein